MNLMRLGRFGRKRPGKLSGPAEVNKPSIGLDSRLSLRGSTPFREVKCDSIPESPANRTHVSAVPLSRRARSPLPADWPWPRRIERQRYSRRRTQRLRPGYEKLRTPPLGRPLGPPAEFSTSATTRRPRCETEGSAYDPADDNPLNFGYFFYKIRSGISTTAKLRSSVPRRRNEPG
jgi:hypothetical protein